MLYVFFLHVDSVRHKCVPDEYIFYPTYYPIYIKDHCVFDQVGWLLKLFLQIQNFNGKKWSKFDRCVRLTCDKNIPKDIWLHVKK